MNLDDPKLTAYALGEISDPAELLEIETWLATSGDGRAYVADTRDMAAYLRTALHPAEPPTLTAEQRAALLNEGSEGREMSGMDQRDSQVSQRFPQPANRSRRRRWSVVGLTALAACLASAALLPWADLLRLRESSVPTVAVHTQPTAPGARPNQLKKENTSRSVEQLDIVDAKQLSRDEAKADSTPPSVADIPITPPVAEMAPPAAFAPVDSLAKLKTAESEPAVATLSAAPLASEPPPASPSANAYAAIAGAVPPGTRLDGTEGKNIFATTSPAPAATPSGLGGVARKNSTLAAPTVASRRLALPGAFDKDLADRTSSNTEAYDDVPENDFLPALDNPLSTFSIDVDTASYANVRRFLNEDQLPPKGAVRIEEMLNYFTYDYAKPDGDAPFSTNLEVADCPWQPAHRLVRIGLKGKEIPVAERKSANLVFLIDVSGSMDEPNKLPLLKQSLRLLVDQLGENDRVALTVYAGSSGLVLPSTADKDAIRAALDNLKAGGSTNGASGIQLAYREAVAHFQNDGINRVILATDGDFNVGTTSQSALADLITEKAKSGVFLSVLGFGTGNIKDSIMEKLADRGNGNYAYIDSLQEGKKVLVEQMGGTLVTIAKDVKIQVEFNPAVVSHYRLIGYENRALKKEDFADDKKDAGEIGAGHTVTALYEVVMVGSMSAVVHAQPLKYMKNNIQQMPSLPSGEMLTVKLRYKEPAGDTSKLLEFPLTDTGRKMDAASRDFQFASAVAEFGQLLRNSAHRQLATWESLIARADEAKGEDKGGYRAEFVKLVRKAEQLSSRTE